jgi:branched-chain amino acid transport system ATP-binding protein
MLLGCGGKLVTANTVLKVDGIDVYYKDFQALWGVSLEAPEGEIISVIGANGAGKSTLLNTIAGLMTPQVGTVEFLGESINNLSAHQAVARQIALVPEGRRIFPRLTVYENLILGSYAPRARSHKDDNLRKVHDLFPRLEERSSQMANTLSGGEQQMLAIGRAMMSEPKLLLCDEISLGLAPVVIKDIYQRLRKINEEGITIVLVEQDIRQSLKVANRAYVMLEGRVVLEGKPAEMTEAQVKEAYFGI